MYDIIYMTFFEQRREDVAKGVLDFRSENEQFTGCGTHKAGTFSLGHPETVGHGVPVWGCPQALPV